MQTNCPRCGVSLVCNPAGACWCKQARPIVAVPADPAARCLCATCLAKLLHQAELDAGSETPTGA
ncbi:MAG TPA: hypothetical protein VL752_11410 [Acidisoma sp.]|uniref:hypothetical protein n=1 Tax=Acidisoma sp. TaxID=1872115 RepID=UPI002CBBEEF1|nr:hypothetical protein [Acidisoma sp.]HTI01543.1 hypothetical protein [Acidisoma sp.]